MRWSGVAHALTADGRSHDPTGHETWDDPTGRGHETLDGPTGPVTDTAMTSHLTDCEMQRLITSGMVRHETVSNGRPITKRRRQTSNSFSQLRQRYEICRRSSDV